MAWTNVPKPIESSIVSGNPDAEPWGLLLAITSVHANASTSVITGWSDVAKPTSSIWTLVSKPIS